ncbi:MULTISPECIES: PAS domain-containing protein [unclassified Sphingobium]|uniref:PAS domain-containing protein n=1 Tax=unclassified Sphingobium TaxID=2611147 RepID=UPI0011A38E99|nr:MULTISPECIES: PAS domain-containing protein [unclassified Sphingobium]MBG6119464.1 PAS domain S-box-containing protein [Sphingobium sp. JAI105]
MSSSGKTSPARLTWARVIKDYDIPRLQRLALGVIKQSVLIADGNREDVPIIFANQAFISLTGYSQDEIIGRNCRFLSGLETSQETRDAIRQAVSAREPWMGVILNYRKDGSAFWNELSLTPIHDDELGHFYLGVQNDVTERRELEARLRESQRMEAIGKLSGGIAHDFNNILALILGNAELIAGESKAGSLVGEAASDIMEAADGGSNLVTRMLQYARGEGGTAEEMQVNTTIEVIVSLLSRTISEPIRIETDLSAAVGRIMVDRTLFETALLNLALNARDAMPKGGAIRISTRRRSNAGPALGTVAVVAVSDSGMGMDDTVQARAFEPFFTTKLAGHGNGLGLPMVYNFVKQSGGDITIDSAPGRGTTVSMLLPIEEPSVRMVSQDDERPRILIVEDDAKIRKLLALHLGRGGYAVDEAPSAEEALALLDAGLQPAMLISDIRLRDGMTGVELVDMLQARKIQLPMLLMTGFAEELESHASRIGGVPVLRKPFRSAELLAEVQAMTSPRHKGRGGS